MKKHLITLAGLLTMTIAAFSVPAPYEQFAQFKQMMIENKVKWLHHEKDKHNDKYALMAKHAKEWGTFYKTFFAELSMNKESSKVSNLLAEAVKIAERQREEWKNRCEEQHKASQALYEKQVAALDAFKNSLNKNKPLMKINVEEMEEAVG